MRRTQEERKLQNFVKAEEARLKKHDKQVAIQRLQRIAESERQRRVDRIAADDRKLMELKERK